MSRRRNDWSARVTIGLALVGALGVSGMVAAQPTPGTQAPPQSEAPEARPSTPPPAPAVEAPPPVNVTPPPPMAVPALNSTDVAPAPPPDNSTADSKAPEVPQRRTRYDVAVLEVLDKVTAGSLRFEAPVGQPVRYKSLIFTVRACEKTTPDEPIQDSIAYLEIQSQPQAEPGRLPLPPKQAFKGWMFASSPSLNPLEHPVYDAWVIDCRASSPASAAPAR